MLHSLRKTLNLCVVSIGIGLVPVCTGVMAQTWPQRPVTIVVPLAAGGTTMGSHAFLPKA